MATHYYRISNPEILKAHSDYQQSVSEWRSFYEKAAAHFGADPVLRFSFPRYHFYGVAFPDAAAFLNRSDRDLWTAPSNVGCARRVRARAKGKGAAQRIRELKAEWASVFGSAPADPDICSLLELLGSGWGNFVMAGGGIERVGDFLYVYAGVPLDGFSSSEITASEFDSGKNMGGGD